MSNVVEICNLSLSHARQDNTIASFDNDQSTEAIRLRRIFYPTLNRLLQKHPWHFSENEISLALLDKEAKANFEYVYSIPSNALSVTKVAVEGGTFMPFNYGAKLNIYKVFPSDDGLSLEINSNVQLPRAIIRQTVNNIKMLDALFVEYFAWELAKRLSELYSLESTAKKEIAQSAYLAEAEAKESDALQEDVSFDEENVYVSERGYIGNGSE